MKFQASIQFSVNSCKTTEGLDCVFPFIYHGKSYCGCMPGVGLFDPPDECATKVDDSGISKEFGSCGQDCNNLGS